MTFYDYIIFINFNDSAWKIAYNKVRKWQKKNCHCY